MPCLSENHSFQRPLFSQRVAWTWEGPASCLPRACTGASWCLPPPCPLLRRHLVHHSCPCDDRLAFTQDPPCRTHPEGPGRAQPRGLPRPDHNGRQACFHVAEPGRPRQPVGVSSASRRAAGQENLDVGPLAKEPSQLPLQAEAQVGRPIQSLSLQQFPGPGSGGPPLLLFCFVFSLSLF